MQREPVLARRPLVAGIFALAVGMGIGRFAFTPILPAMRDAFALSPVTLGALASANYLGYLVGAVAAIAPLPQRTHQWVLRISLVTVVVSTALMAGTTAPPLWIVLRWVAGLASAGVFVFSATIVLGWLGRQGRLDLTGAFFSGVGLGIAGSGSVVLVLHHLVAGAEAWRWEWLAMAILAALLMALSWVWLPRTSEGVSDQTQGAQFRSGEDAQWLPLLLLGTAYFLAGAGYIVAGTFLVAIVSAMPHLAGLGAGAWILVGLAAAPSTLFWFRCASRIGPIPALGIAYLSQTASLVLPVLSHHAVGAALAALLFGGSFMGITALTIGEARRRVSPRRAARTIGIFTTLFALGQVIGPLLAAFLAEEQGSFDQPLLVAAGAVAVGTLLVGGAAITAPVASREA